MTGEDLHGLFLKIGVPQYVPWSSWNDTPARMRFAFDAVAAILSEQQADRVYEATAGEDI